MARFRGTIQGDRGEASRLGHQVLEVYAGSWSGGVHVQMYARANQDWAIIEARGHGDHTNPQGTIFDGPVSDLHGMLELWRRRDEFQAFVALTEGAKR